MATAARIAEVNSVPENVLRYFMEKTSSTLEFAHEVFDELVDYLGSSGHERVPSVIVDEAWHSFLLHSREYAEYCDSVFGRFIHHVPSEVTTDILDRKCSTGCTKK